MIPGDVIGGRFVIQGHVARGGMGDVYRATDGETGLPVAVKLILVPDPQHHARLAREARALAELRDPAIVRYIAHDAREGEAFIATEWVEGPSLSERLRSRPLTIEQSLRLAHRIARALGTAHGRGMIHRDVKPSNILLPDDDTDRAKLADFGIVRTADRDRLTVTGAGIGTPEYMAPEQVRGQRELTPAVDVFALGCVLFKCLTGQSAFHAPTVDAVLARIVMSQAPRVRDLREDVPEPVDELVGLMLAAFPDVRPRDGSDVAGRLERVLLDVRDAGAVSAARRPAPSLTGRQLQPVAVVFVQPKLVITKTITAPVNPAFDPPAPPTRETSESIISARERHAASAALATTQRAVADMGVEPELLLTGSIAAKLTGGATAHDLAVRAVRCAVAIRTVAPRLLGLVDLGRRDLLHGEFPPWGYVDRNRPSRCADLFWQYHQLFLVMLARWLSRRNLGCS